LNVKTYLNREILFSVMDFRTLKELVRQGEGKHLEFKLKSNHPERIVREVVAFANSDGGKLLIGVSDDRIIKGLKYADEDEYILVRAIEKYCSVGIEYSIDRVQIAGDCAVLVFTIPPSDSRPHYVLMETIDPKNQESKLVRRTYVRVADKCVQASWEMREILRRGRQRRDVQFIYGEKERKLIHHLNENASITLNDFAAIAHIARKTASQTLILLVLANVIKIHPDEVTDKFTKA
jgi:predicted HTH transcriptional regulator